PPRPPRSSRDERDRRPHEQNTSRRRLAQRRPEIAEPQTALDGSERRPIRGAGPERERSRAQRKKDNQEHARQADQNLAAPEAGAGLSIGAAGGVLVRAAGSGPAEACREDERDPRAVGDAVRREPAHAERLERATEARPSWGPHERPDRDQRHRGGHRRRMGEEYRRDEERRARRKVSILLDPGDEQQQQQRDERPREPRSDHPDVHAAL